MDKRALRLALKAKLDHRRVLIDRNKHLFREVERERSKNEFLMSTLGNPLVNMALDQCADAIIKMVLKHGIQASEVVAEQSIDNGDYLIGIDIPSLHIRERLFRPDLNSQRLGEIRDTPIRTISYDGGHKW